MAFADCGMAARLAVGCGGRQQASCTPCTHACAGDCQPVHRRGAGGDLRVLHGVRPSWRLTAMACAADCGTHHATCHSQLVFHSLSNMPLDEPLLYGVHARFWQQPNILAFAAAGVAMSAAAAAAMRLLTGERAPQLSDTVASGKPARSWRRRPARLCLRVCFVALCAMQGARWRDALDHSATRCAPAAPTPHGSWLTDSGRYMERYAKAIMDPLPQGALLLTNYDHQWTSIRYLHVCEGYRLGGDAVRMQLAANAAARGCHRRPPQERSDRDQPVHDDVLLVCEAGASLPQRGHAWAAAVPAARCACGGSARTRAAHAPLTRR